VNQIERAVFLATTNYPENLGARIINRPSRFDKRFFIGHPDLESRKLYLRHIIGDAKIAALNIDVDKWVEDTDEFSIAHLKELFTAVVILGDEYEAAIETLRSMREQRISSDEDEARRSMGFAPAGLQKAIRKYSDTTRR
jgi:SpoVK/Ycf46/Vps4 family AAA+-type ATPase